MNPARLTLKSPAKLNLFLHITGRRPDGYHELQTLFQLLDLCDTLEFTVTATPGLLSFHCTDPLMPLQNNLVLRAARLLREHCRLPQASAAITLHKQIPSGAGLGGGSSNAAITLLGLNRLWKTGLDKRQLCALGLQLGADVPLFITGRSALATGIGEQLRAVDLAPTVYLVIWPGISVSTAEIFSRPELTRNTPAIRIADFLAGGGRNDCEPVVRQLYPPVNEALEWLGRFGPARMTGTGSCVFAPFKTRREAAAALKELPANFRGYIARGCNRLPRGGPPPT